MYPYFPYIPVRDRYRTRREIHGEAWLNPRNSSREYEKNALEKILKTLETILKTGANCQDYGTNSKDSGTNSKDSGTVIKTLELPKTFHKYTNLHQGKLREMTSIMLFP